MLTVKIDISGSGYSPALEQEIRENLSKYYEVYARGCKAPAAGPEILVQLTIEGLSRIGEIVAEELPGVIIGGAAAEVVSRVRSAFIRWRSKSSIENRDSSASSDFAPEYLAEVRLILPSYDLVIWSIPDEGTDVDQYDLNELVQRVEEFVRSENEENSLVSRVVLPCEVVAEGNRKSLVEGHGNPNLWHVFYRDGERWPSAVYDADDRCFLSDLY